MAIQVRILGPLEVLRDGAAVQPTSAKQRLLLALLAVHANEVVSVDALVHALWRDRPPATAAGVLQTYVSQLRKALEPDVVGGRPHVVVRAEPGYRLVVGSEELDVACFERLLAAGRAAMRHRRPQRAAALLRDGLGLWRGAALADVADEAAVRAEAQRLDALRVEAVEERVGADVALGRHGQLVGELTQLVAVHPLRERLWAQLMLCLYRVGRQADALGAYQQLRHRLVEELGLDPSAELIRLEHDILVHSPTLEWRPLEPDAERVPGRRTPAMESGLPTGREPLAFCGRREEMRRLRRWWRDPAPSTGVVLVTGEAGVGKTRLATAFAREVEEAGATVLYGRALEAGGSSYEPVLGAFQQFVATAADDVIEALDDHVAGALARLVPELDERRPGLGALTSAWDQVDRSWFYGALADCVAGASRAPVLVVLDDLQWADRPALLVLSRLAERDRGVRIVGTCRPPATSPPNFLADFVFQLRHDDRPAVLLPLGGLTCGDVIDVVAALAGGHLSDEGRRFAADLHRRTEGHPFFVRETLDQLRDTGGISVAEGVWASSHSFDELGIADGVKDMVGQRLSRLSPAARGVLRAAAVVGPEFDLDVVAAVVGRSGEEVLDGVEDALDAGLVGEDPARLDRYGFVHALVHEVLLAEISRSRRARLEWRTGQAWEALRRHELDEHAGELARHFAAGAAVGDPAIAVGWCLRAGTRAMERFAYEEAVGHCEAALAVMALDRGTSDEQRVDVLITLGHAANRAGDPERWQSSCLEAVSLARTIGDPQRLARAAISLLGTQAQGATDDRMIQMLEEAATALRAPPQAAGHQTLLAEVLARLSGYLTNTHPVRSAELAAEAIAIAREAGDPRTLALALMNSTQTHALARDEHRARLHEAVRLAEAAGDAEIVLGANSNAMAGALMWADRDEFDRRLAEFARVANAIAAPIPLLLSAIDHAGAAALDGNYHTAQRQFLDADRRAEVLGDPNLRGNIAAGLHPVERELGQRSRSIDRIRQDVAEKRANHVERQATLIRRLCEAGELDEATERLDRLLAQPGLLRSGFIRRYSLVTLAEAAETLRHTEAATQLSTWLQDELRSGHCVIIGPNAYFGAIRRYLGLLALTLGDTHQAVDHHDAALAIHERMRARGWAARSRYDLTRALLARGAPSDTERAAEMIHQAADIARELGMTRLLDELGTLSIPATASSTRRGAPASTER